MMAFEEHDSIAFRSAPLGGTIKIAAWELIQYAFLFRRRQMRFDLRLPESIAIARVDPL